MPKQDVEFSKEGIKISYLRLLSDSAAGFIVILFGVAAYYLPVYGVPLQKVYNIGMSTEAKILLIVLFTLFATPLGLFINAMSWLLPFGRLQMRMQKYWFDEEWRIKLVKKDWFVRPIKDEFAFDTHAGYFDLSSKDVWYERSQLVKQAMYIYHPEVTDGFEHLRGIRTLLRNAAWLLLLFLITWPCVMFYLHSLGASPLPRVNGLLAVLTAVACVVLAAGFMLATSLLGFYYASLIYYRCYILCTAAGVTNGFKGEVRMVDNEIIQTLSGSSKSAKPHLRE